MAPVELLMFRSLFIESKLDPSGNSPCDPVPLKVDMSNAGIGAGGAFCTPDAEVSRENCMFVNLGASLLPPLAPAALSAVRSNMIGTGTLSLL